ncbi:hypothetical protein [Burkholderia gladioli]|uniref:hypothetical protein n=1 Tax=Burkholderia gladioli TaxID=28095 RepID=UPI0016402357|nr:hypothetical protein [Burkholderia gladioli]
MIKRGLAAMALIATIFAVSACGGGDSNNGGSTGGAAVGTSSGTTTGSPAVAQKATVLADMRAANTVGIAAQGGAQTGASVTGRAMTSALAWMGVSAAAANESAHQIDSDIVVDDLVSVDVGGNVRRVFNASFQIYGVKATTNYLIVAGNFTRQDSDPSGKPVFVDAKGNPQACYLVAVKKTATGKPGDLMCLATVPVGSYNPVLAGTNPHYAHLGVDTRGTDVYFTDGMAGTLYKWSESDAAPTIIFHRTPVSPVIGMSDVFIDHSGTSNLCVLYPAITLSGNDGVYYGDVYCGTDAGLTSTLSGNVNNSVQAESRALGQYLLVARKKIDLADLSVTDRVVNGSNYGLPSGNANLYQTASGATIQRAYAWTLSYTTNNGDTCMLAERSGSFNTGCPHATMPATNTFFQTVLGLGAYTWAYGTSEPYNLATGNYLAKVDNATLELEPTNYLASAGFASITGMRYTEDRRIVVMGLDASNQPTYAYIDATGSILPSSQAPSFMLSETLGL